MDMQLPVIQGVIRRRILVNFRVDPAVMQAQLPARFRPKLQAGYSIAGICLIRLDSVRPRFIPRLLGLSSENAAHRVAFRWQADGDEKEGVFIPRRDTGSLMNHLAGGRLFPGEHHRAKFTVRESSETIDLSMRSDDRTVSVRVRGKMGGGLPGSSCFGSLAQASAFFQHGSVGYSMTSDAGRLDGIELRTHGWSMEPLQVEEIHSSYFSDASKFPKGSVVFDCALVMRNIAHEWLSAEDLYV
jgi:hypothetical protein